MCQNPSFISTNMTYVINKEQLDRGRSELSHPFLAISHLCCRRLHCTHEGGWGGGGR